MRAASAWCDWVLSSQPSRPSIGSMKDSEMTIALR